MYELLKKSSMSFPDKIAVIDDRTHITFLQLTRNSRKMAAILEELSLKCGARVLAIISNSVEYVLSFFSVNYIGGCGVRSLSH